MTTTNAALPQGKKPMLSFVQALSQLLEAVSCNQKVQQQPLQQALGWVLAEDILSPLQIPAYTNAAMDGYAFRHSDALAAPVLTLVGQSLAGHPYQGPLPEGCCIRIMTGAKLPAELDTVVMQEQVTQQGPDLIQFNVQPKQGEHVRLAGSEISPGALVLKKGQRLGPLHLGLAATLGYATLPVYQQLKVGLISTGDELVAPGLPLAEGQLYDSNSVVLAAMLKRLDVVVTDYGWLADEPVQLKAVFARAAAEMDVLITSGGVSVGDADYTRQVLTELGNINFWQVAIKPGKPLAFGQIGHCWFFGLPGNPVSAVLTFDQLAQPAIRKLAGEHWQGPQYFTATAGAAFSKKPGRLDFQRASFVERDGALDAKPVGQDSSGMLSSLVAANCLAVLEQPRADVQPGERIHIQLLSNLLS